ncbi:MAG: hypothetical protein E6Q88_07995 [Lysobacteraceae bacterium]|nr:MAG: hypothetical protein E6Q88_07995 [Xanthomonadaceae bacterium]
MSASPGSLVPDSRLLKAAIFRIEHLLMPSVQFWRKHAIGQPHSDDPHVAFKQALIEQAVAAVEQATMRLLGKSARVIAVPGATHVDRIADVLAGDVEADDYLELADATEDLRILLATGDSDFSDPRTGVPPMVRNLRPT